MAIIAAARVDTLAAPVDGALETEMVAPVVVALVVLVVVVWGAVVTAIVVPGAAVLVVGGGDVLAAAAVEAMVDGSSESGQSAPFAAQQHSRFSADQESQVGVFDDVKQVELEIDGA